MLALYIGGMGAKEENFHKKMIERLGFDVQEVQDLFLAGKQEEAIKAVPDELADEIALCGPEGRIRERLQDWKKSDVTTLMVGRSDDPQQDTERLRTIAELVLG